MCIGNTSSWGWAHLYCRAEVERQRLLFFIYLQTDLTDEMQRYLFQSAISKQFYKKHGLESHN